MFKIFFLIFFTEQERYEKAKFEDGMLLVDDRWLQN
jgi:hypothetical protein